MADIKQKRSFDKAFKAAVPNSEGIIWIEHPSAAYKERKVFFMLDGKKVHIPMYMDTESIDQWKEYFIEFIETGKFDPNFYVQVYGDKIPDNVKEQVHSFTMTTSYGNQFYCHNVEAGKWLSLIRSKYGDAGMKTVPKPKAEIKKLVCTNCGSTNVQVKAWVNANTNEYISDVSDGEAEDSWCDNCKGSHGLEYKVIK